MAALYFGDNGRLTCSALHCAGMTAHFSKMRTDLSGGEMQRLTEQDAQGFKNVTGVDPTCESCGAGMDRTPDANRDYWPEPSDSVWGEH